MRTLLTILFLLPAGLSTGCNPAAPAAATPAASAAPRTQAETPAPLTQTANPDPFTPTAAAETLPVQTDASEPAEAGNADVTFVRAVLNPDGSWTFHVTVAHPDTGWEDYANGWDVVLPDGSVVRPDPESPFTRLLLHPHVEEQPFTRSQSGISIPAGTPTVTVRAHDLVDGFGGAEIILDLENDLGNGYEIERP
jgi:hypothetical protein